MELVPRLPITCGEENEVMSEEEANKIEDDQEEQVEPVKLDEGNNLSPVKRKSKTEEAYKKPHKRPRQEKPEPDAVHDQDKDPKKKGKKQGKESKARQLNAKKQPSNKGNTSKS